MPATAETLDGRRLRRQQNREAVVLALVALFEQGCYEPSAAQIATRAGLSPRSLFRYFDDIDDLNRAAIEHQLARAQPLLDPQVAPDAPAWTRVERLVEARLRLHQAVAPAARAARISSHRSPVLDQQIHRARAFLREQLAELFAPELAGQPPGTLAAIDALCCFETYELLRHEHGLSPQATRAALVHALGTLLHLDERR